MRTLKTSEAAAELNISPHTLRTWERRFQFPNTQRSAGGHRMYYESEIAAMRDALREGLSVSSAISVAREEFGADVATLVRALVSFSAERADRTLEASLALRSVERTVEEVLLPALAAPRARRGARNAASAFGGAWACAWLRRALTLAPARSQRGSVIIGDACGGVVDADMAPTLALELFCARGGVCALSLPVAATGGLADAVAAFEPDAVVVAGAGAADTVVARWAYTLRASAGARPVLLFHRAVACTADGVRALPDSPTDAQRELLDVLAGEPVLVSSARA